MEMVIVIVVGLAAGLHTSTWGMYKDAPYEGFTWPRYFRSTVIGAVAASLIYQFNVLDVTNASQIVVLFGVTYVLERALVEFYKTFLREQDQSKYFIPMQFSIQGNVVKSRALRLSAGAAYFTGVVLTVYGISYLQHTGFHPSGWVVVLTVGSIGGWISAFGGAWKDAPKEGFEILKFFRSPAMALSYAVMLASFTDNYLFICMGALGYTIATIETYKTFFFPSRPRGKFQGMVERFPDMNQKRQYFVPAYVLIWAAVITTIVLGFMGPHGGLI